VVVMPELAVLAVPARSRREVGAKDGLQCLLARVRFAGVVGEPARIAVPALAVLEEESAERSRRGGARLRGGGGGGGRGDGTAAAASSVAPLFVRHGIGVNGCAFSREESSVTPRGFGCRAFTWEVYLGRFEVYPASSSLGPFAGSKSDEVLLE
jgi:hypothetical protein